MRILGISGGIGSGKSKVAELLAKRGAVVIDADRIGHALLEDDGILAQIRNRFGLQVFNTQGSIDRRKLAVLVFGNSQQAQENLKDLEAILHPAIRLEAKRQIERERHADTAVVVLDAPLLFEAGWDDECDLLVFVEAPQELRYQRVAKRGWNREEFLRREHAQLSMAEKRNRSKLVVSNSGSLEDLESQVDQIWSVVSQLPSRN